MRSRTLKVGAGKQGSVEEVEVSVAGGKELQASAAGHIRARSAVNQGGLEQARAAS